MWNKIGVMGRVGALCLALGTGFVVVQGCDGSSKPSPTPVVEKAPTPPKTSAESKPVAAEPMDVAAILGDISRAKDLLAWYQTRSAYQNHGTPNPEVDAAFAAKEAELLELAPAKPVNDALDLVDFNWKLTGAESSEGQKETFLATWLFRVNKDIVLEPGHDVKLVLRGWLDKAHQRYFDEGTRYFEQTYTLKPPITDWETGEYRLVSYEIYKKVPNVPYRIRTIFPLVRILEEGKTAYAGSFGESIDCGWHADVGEAAVPASSS